MSKRNRKPKERLKTHNPNDGFSLEWFHPVGQQNWIIDAMNEKELVIVAGPSGCGKSTVVLWKALMDYKRGVYKKVFLIKNPTEAGDDKIGYLSGSEQEKLKAHMDSMKGIFHQFMSPNKLENDIRNGNIVLSIPNYLLGKTIDDSVIILEEAQTMSPKTIKLCSERAGKGSIVVLCGDSNQPYSVSKRKDGLSDLISRVTYKPTDMSPLIPRDNIVGFIQLSSKDNHRSGLSRFITELYEGEF